MVRSQVLHSLRSLFCTSTTATPYKRYLNFQRRSVLSITVPFRLTSPKTVQVRKHTCLIATCGGSESYLCYTAIPLLYALKPSQKLPDVTLVQPPHASLELSLKQINDAAGDEAIFQHECRFSSNDKPSRVSPHFSS